MDPTSERAQRKQQHDGNGSGVHKGKEGRGLGNLSSMKNFRMGISRSRNSLYLWVETDPWGQQCRQGWGVGSCASGSQFGRQTGPPQPRYHSHIVPPPPRPPPRLICQGGGWRVWLAPAHTSQDPTSEAQDTPDECHKYFLGDLRTR